MPRLTTPSISEMIAEFFGRRASNSSETRGRPPVMSLDFVTSCGILAEHVAGVDRLAGSAAIRIVSVGSG